MPRRPPPKPRTDETLHCRHFGTCGGCSLLDQPIQWQLHDKVAASEELLAPFLDGQHIACAESTWTPRHFRTRLLYPVRGDRDGLPTLGIYAFRSHELVRIEECRTQDAWLTAFGRAAEGVLRRLKVQPFHPESGRGVVKALWARLASGTGQVLAGIVTRPGVFPDGAAIATALQEVAGQVPAARKSRQLVGVVHSISERDDEFLLGDRHVPLRGTDHVVDRRDDLTFRVSAGSFYQVHAEANELLYRPALAMCGDVRGRQVIDGYGGVGTFALRLAKAGAAHVTLVEQGAAACRDAEHNAKVNGMANVTVVHSPFAGSKLPARADLLVVDPPRAGLQSKTVARIVGARPQRVLYVSCSAESLAHDLAGLSRGGYRVTAARLCDMFPHTEHVELVVMLDRGV
ncbi:MAG TPA: 23S rRNA (uracil(1939)-C(5))-methyltransferase RlmD [Planctomycetota bacterium]|nr:23S rRNA (uracil(1939)-C(5))-methyltransferase RlmD [Planctomycetota bacterium]